MLEIPAAATGLLREHCEAGMIGLPDFHLARRLTHRFDVPEEVQLAFALTARELRLGSVCLPLADAPKLLPLTEVDDGLDTGAAAELAWPEPDAWLAAVEACPLVGERCPFVLEGGRLYLGRFHAQERQVADALALRRALPLVDGVPPVPGAGEPDEQQDAAVSAALQHMTTVVTGGPGTGKTTTVVRILNSLGAAKPISIALAAPTGKAARQLFDSVVAHLDPLASRGTPWSGTLHKLLGMRPRSTDLAHDGQHPLPYDIVVVDEVSMVSLEQMAALLAAVAPTTRLVLVGDPHQLRSVEAGAVLADIVANPSLTQPGSVVELRTNRRSNAEISALAAAIDRGETDEALRIVDDAATITWYDHDGGSPARHPQLAEDVTAQADDVLAAATAGDGRTALDALRRHRILAAHRLGPFGVHDWSRAARELVAARHLGYGVGERYVGQPLLVTRNTEEFSNGDVAVVVRVGDELLAAVDQGDEPPLIPPVLLDGAADLHAMTIHKAQGGQYDVVSVVLPPEGSPLATRELLYTAVTRARHEVRLYGTKAAFAEAVATPVRRASGLAEG